MWVYSAEMWLYCDYCCVCFLTVVHYMRVCVLICFTYCYCICDFVNINSVYYVVVLCFVIAFFVCVNLCLGWWCCLCLCWVMCGSIYVFCEFVFVCISLIDLILRWHVWGFCNVWGMFVFVLMLICLCIIDVVCLLCCCMLHVILWLCVVVCLICCLFCVCVCFDVMCLLCCWCLWLMGGGEGGCF